jgi:hypothetical protein
MPRYRLPSPRDAGSVLIADLALAATIVIAVASVASAFGVAAGRQQDHRESARQAAVVLARSGNMEMAAAIARRHSPSSVVSITEHSGVVTVSVESSTTLVHPVVRRVVVSIRGVATMPIAPYRSGR